MGVTPPDAEPDVDTTATFEDVDGNGMDDDCQVVVAVADPDAVTAEQLTVDVDANGVISTTEAAHSVRIGGKNCNHGGYVSWIAHQNGDCATEPTQEEPTAEEPGDGDEPTEGESAVLVVTTPPDAEPDADACDEPADEADAASVKKDHEAAAAARLAAKAERKAAHAAAKAERTLAHATSKAERQAAHAAARAERAAAHAAKSAERNAAKAANAKHKGH
jgi:hypothetical protein